MAQLMMTGFATLAPVDGCAESDRYAERGR
jgi:hypothetical protein